MADRYKTKFQDTQKFIFLWFLYNLQYTKSRIMFWLLELYPVKFPKLN